MTEQQKNKKEFMYWAVGIIIALIGIAFPIWFGNKKSPTLNFGRCEREANLV